MPVPVMAVSSVKSLYWEVFPPMPTRRVYCTPVYQDGLLYVLGGCSETGLPLDTAEVLDVVTQTWSPLPPIPTARAGAAAVSLGKRLLVIGGMDAEQRPLASVEIYNTDEGKWEKKAGVGQPSMGISAVEKATDEMEISKLRKITANATILLEAFLSLTIPVSPPQSITVCCQVSCSEITPKLKVAKPVVY
ncbi:UNVERIFIED_CONTAM: hypothetical protein FKN15_002685 [Acipenser sinensis]